MLLLKIDSSPLTFQIPPGTKYSTHGWMLVDLPITNFNASQIAQYKINEITDATLLSELLYIDHTVLDDGTVVSVTTVVDANPEDISAGHLVHFDALKDPDQIRLFLAGYKYLSNLEIQVEYDAKFANLGVSTSSLEASTFTQQLAEAQAFIANNSFPTPMLSVLSAASGITVTQLASDAIAKQAAYQSRQATLLGQMLADKQAVNNCSTPLEVRQLGWI